MRNDVISYLDDHAEEALRLLIELAQIPAPSKQEERRAEFCLIGSGGRARRMPILTRL